MNNDLRWKQRFQNFEKAYLLLNEVISRDVSSLSQLEKEGFIQRFEVLIEISWNVLKDYLESQGYDKVKNSRMAIKKAFEHEIIRDVETWMEALEKRNMTSHIYNNKILQDTTQFITDDFYPIVRDLYFQLKEEL